MTWLALPYHHVMVLTFFSTCIYIYIWMDGWMDGYSGFDTRKVDRVNIMPFTGPQLEPSHQQTWRRWSRFILHYTTPNMGRVKCMISMSLCLFHLIFFLLRISVMFFFHWSHNLINQQNIWCLMKILFCDIYQTQWYRIIMSAITTVIVVVELCSNHIYLQTPA